MPQSDQPWRLHNLPKASNFSVALRELIVCHGVTRPRVFGGAAQRGRYRMRTKGRDARV